MDIPGKASGHQNCRGIGFHTLSKWFLKLPEMFGHHARSYRKKDTANCDSPEINMTVGSNRPWLNGTPEPAKTLTFADVADVSGGECSALVLKDWEEFAVDARIAGGVGNAYTSYPVLGMTIEEGLTELEIP